MPILGSLPDLVSGDKIQNIIEIANAQTLLLKEYNEMLEEHRNLKKLILLAEKAAGGEENQVAIDLLEGLGLRENRGGSTISKRIISWDGRKVPSSG